MPDSVSKWLSLLEQRHHKPIDLGLERCAQVWTALGAPRPAAKVITVGGTNGKGSTVAYLAAMLASSGSRVGTYTSPHLLRFNERIRLPGGDIEDAALLRAFDRVEAVRAEVSLTYFEFTTLAAFLAMHEEQLDWAVLEVGLGGRLDTVNLVDADVVVLTPIGLDHQEYLGVDRECIGAEKAGIMRIGVPVVCGDRSPPSSVVRTARERSAPLYRLGKEFDFRAETGYTLRILDQHHAMPNPPLPGVHQLDNLATAMTAANLAVPGLLSERPAWQTALARVEVPGRFSSHPQDHRLVLDVGHNPMAARVVAEELARDRGGKVHCVLGMLRDKDVESVAEALGSQVYKWYLASLDGARGQSSQELERRLRCVLDDADSTCHESVPAALSAAQDAAGHSDRILVFGSFETVGKALRALDAARQNCRLNC